MNIILLTRGDENLNEADIEAFWAQGVCMDDWDYIILAPVDQIEENNASDGEDQSAKEWRAKEYILDRLLTGCCSNKWYKAEYRERYYAVGVAYHG